MNYKKWFFGLIMIWAGIVSAQDLQVIDGQQQVQMTVGQASVIDYWARKGIASIPYIDKLELNIQLLEKSAKFQDQINFNLRSAQEEYRTQVSNAVARNAELQRVLSETKESRDSWKLKAQRRGYQNLALVLLVGVITYVTVTD